ncbi:hypothetical protein [Kitasatospora griseola]|uniref:hypothetical protein n=1 Tax=Kitasatospora griseola TaxID=2064 RepID=UPI003805F2A4
MEQTHHRPRRRTRRGFTLSYWWAVVAADTLLVCGLVRAGTGVASAVVLGVGLVAVPCLVARAVR